MQFLRFRTRGFAAHAMLVVLMGVASAVRAAENGMPAGGSVFATIGGTTITMQDYEMEVATAARNKFFHGKPPEAELIKLRRDVGEQMVNQTLLVAEARRRKLAPDAAAIDRQLAALDARYANSPEWQRTRTERLAALRRKLETDSIVAQLEQATRIAPEPSAAAVERYYAEHPDKFTEPEQLKISLILLKVDPGSPKAQWEGARAEGEAIVKRLRAGADFAQLASLHSSDPSAAKGGDLGYVHRGMLPEPAQDALDKLKPGAVADPVVLLEGIAVVRLDDRRVAKRNPLPIVQDRARELLRREQAESAWNALIVRLRAQAQPRIDESRYAAALASGNAVPSRSPVQ